MSTFPGSPRLVRGGFVLLDPGSGTVRRILALQYNPDTLTRTLQIKGVNGDASDRSEALRLKGPPIETFKIDAEIDATDQLETANSTAGELGLHAALAALESMAYPSVAQLLTNQRLAQQGTLEIAPMESSLVLFVWSQHRITPVRVTDLSVTEEAHDPRLNPIRAKVSIGLRVLSVDDLGFDHRGGQIFMTFLQHKELLAQRFGGAGFSSLGIQGIP